MYTLDFVVGRNKIHQLLKLLNKSKRMYVHSMCVYFQIKTCSVTLKVIHSWLLQFCLSYISFLWRSLLRTFAVIIGSSTRKERLVSSGKSFILELTSVTMSLM